jgi:predicted nuclease with TOPRIM domain
MMNYQGHEELREDMGALANAMDELRQQIRELEKKYHDDSPDLVDALAGAFARSGQDIQKVGFIVQNQASQQLH